VTSRLGTARAQILEALAAAGIRAGTSGRFAAPAVILEPAEPWAVPLAMPRRDSRWQLTAIAGAGDSDAALEQLAELVDQIDAALRLVAGCGWPTWSKPRDQLVGDVTHPVCVGVLTFALVYQPPGRTA